MNTLKRFIYRNNDFLALQNLGFKLNKLFIFPNLLALVSIKIWIRYGTYERHNLSHNVPVEVIEKYKVYGSYGRNSHIYDFDKLML